MALIDREALREEVGNHRGRGNISCKKGRVISAEERKARHQRAQHTPFLDKIMANVSK